MKALAVLLFAALSAGAQTRYVLVYGTNTLFNASYPVQTNDVVQMVGTAQGATVKGFSVQGAVLFTGNNTFTGLTNLTVIANPGTPEYATFQITSMGCVASNYVPADAVVIPSDATGSVQIVLESSPDLINWTAAMPGTYGPPFYTNRFFRVRAVVN